MSRPEISFQRIELTYFKEGSVENVLIKDIKPVTSIKRKGRDGEGIKTSKLEKVKIDLQKNIVVKIEQKHKSAENKISIKDIQYEKTKTVEKSGEEDEAAYEDYCLNVREKIKSILEKNRRSFTAEGELYVRFIIEENGIVKDLTLYKSHGKDARYLGAIAIESIKQASPFPPFTGKMDEKELLFKLPIRFTYRK